MSVGLDALPPRWRADRLVRSDLARLVRAGARVVEDGESFVLLTTSPRGVSALGLSPDGGAARLVAQLADAGDLRAPLRWLWLPRAGDLPARVCEALAVEPLPGWNWMSTTRIPEAPDGALVERLDLRADLPAIHDCLADANPTTESDPAGPDEAGWWGVRDGDRLVGVIGAGLRGGASDEGFSWHLHGLGVRPEARTRGLGTALTAAATAAGVAAGADWVSLGVWAANAPAIRIYERLGYRTDHRNRSYRPLDAPPHNPPS